VLFAGFMSDLHKLGKDPGILGVIGRNPIFIPKFSELIFPGYV
jgi:hypothetical protein